MSIVGLIRQVIAAGFSRCRRAANWARDKYQDYKYAKFKSEVKISTARIVAQYGRMNMRDLDSNGGCSKAAEEGNYQAMARYIEAGVNVRQSYRGETLLHTVALGRPSAEQLFAIRYLLEKGVNATMRGGQFGRTALHVLCVGEMFDSNDLMRMVRVGHNRAASVKALLRDPQGRALINVVDENEGLTPLMITALTGDKPVLHELLNNGAKLSHRSKNGHTVVDYLLQKLELHREHQQHFAGLVRDCLRSAAREGCLDEIVSSARSHKLWLQFAAEAQVLFRPNKREMVLAVNQKCRTISHYDPRLMPLIMAFADPFAAIDNGQNDSVINNNDEKRSSSSSARFLRAPTATHVPTVSTIPSGVSTSSRTASSSPKISLT